MHETVLIGDEIKDPEKRKQAFQSALNAGDWIGLYSNEATMFVDVSLNSSISVRQRVIEDYMVVSGRVAQLGKFEGEAIYVPFYYEQGLDGGADDTDYEDVHGDSGMVREHFDVTPYDRDIFPELEGVSRVTLHHSSTGFVRGTTEEN